MKTAIYVRVSRETQTALNQEMALKEYCKRNDMEVYNIYKDEGISGAKTSRPALDQMLQDMRSGCFDAVTIWKLDRLGRSLQHLLDILSELQNKGVRLIVTDMRMDTGTPHGKLFFSIAGAFAEFERELTRERIFLGLERARKQGKHCGRPPGRKDSRQRKKGGYYLRYMDKKPSPHKIGVPSV